MPDSTEGYPARVMVPNHVALHGRMYHTPGFLQSSIDAAIVRRGTVSVHEKSHKTSGWRGMRLGRRLRVEAVRGKDLGRPSGGFARCSST